MDKRHYTLRTLHATPLQHNYRFLRTRQLIGKSSIRAYCLMLCLQQSDLF